MNCTVTIDGGTHPVELKFLDTVNGQDRYQEALVPYVLIKVDLWDNFKSLAVYNAFDHVAAKNINNFAIDFNGEKIEFTNFRYLCGFRKTWGERPQTTNNQTLIGYEPSPSGIDWTEPPIAPMAYGKYIEIGYTTTGARPMLGVRECNWVQDKDARIRYANQGLGLPFHIFEPIAPYNPVMREGYVMGPNIWGVQGDTSKIGMKVDGAHCSNQFLRAALIEGDRIYLDEVIHLGNYCAMHYNGERMWAGQVRKQGRCMTQALFAWHFSGNATLEKKIIDALTYYGTKADDISGIPYGRNNDPTKGYYVPWWEYAYMAYALWQAESFGFIHGRAYLNSILRMQERLGTNCPYWWLIPSNTPIEELPNPPMPVNIREDSARVFGLIMQQRGMKSPWDLNTLLTNLAMWPTKNNIDFKILPPPKDTRPKTFEELVERFMIVEKKVMG